MQRLDRQDFLDNYFEYKPGEHVSLIGPTQKGKSLLAHQLLQVANRPSLDVVSLVMKPRDSTVAEWSQKLGFKEIDHWPPVQWPWQNEPAGYTLWPKHIMSDVEADNDHLREEFRRAIMASYSSGNSIVFGDEVYGLCVELGLSKELTALWTRGSGMGAGLWSATQKPSGTTQGSIPSFVYNSPTWLFLTGDPDARNRQRFNEIGGVDGNAVAEHIMTLRKYEFLVIHRDGPHMSVIGP
jgi:energy-coupling factor transporter ATP-binding protein EcfA2